MKKFLLPRWTRFIGLIILLPLFIYFFIDPDFVDKEPKWLNANMIVIADDFPFESKESIEGVIEETLTRKVNLFNELLLTITLFASWLIGFSRVKVEDEYTWLLRLESMVLALFVNIIILLITNFIIHGVYYIYVMMFQLFIFPLIFSLVFAIRLQKQRGQENEE